MKAEPSPDVRISPPREPLEPEVHGALVTGLESCPDIAFAHLVEVVVAGHQDEPSLSVFVWLRPESLRSMRMALNAVSDAVARALPRKHFVDVLILNSAPELLQPVEEADSLLLENDPDERRRALEALESPEPPPEPPAKPWWWPF